MLYEYNTIYYILIMYYISEYTTKIDKKNWSRVNEYKFTLQIMNIILNRKIFDHITKILNAFERTLQN